MTAERPFTRLVVAPNWIGDCVMSLPVLRALAGARPAGRIAVLARPGPAAIYRAEASADLVLTRSSFVRDAGAARAVRAAEAWILPNSFRAALLGFLSGAPRRIGYDTDRRRWLLTDALPAPDRTGHQLRDYDALLEAAGVTPDPGPPRLPIPESAAGRADRALEAAGLAPGADLALLAPASAFAPTKRWPADRYAALADALAARGLPSALVVGPGERALGDRVAGLARGRVPVLGEDLDPVELAALLSRARVVVANDSGPMHLAAAVGTPVAAFFGPTDPGRTAPSGSASRILDRYVFCSPCFRTECPYGHECMKEIGVEEAVRAVEELLALAAGTSASSPLPPTGGEAG
jgi:heptosyltransferase-2